MTILPKYNLTKEYKLVNPDIEFMIEHYINIQNSSTIIFIHGFNDYHYNDELTDCMIDNDLNVMRITLRNYGLNKTTQPKFYFTNLEEYFFEIDSTFELLSNIKSIHDMNHKIILCGHSTGGLTSIIYANSGKYKSSISKLLLNSPFMDYYFGSNLKSDFIELAMESIVSLYGYFYKNTRIVKEDNSYPTWTDKYVSNGFEIDPKQIINVGGKWTGQIYSTHYYQKMIQNGLIKIDKPIMVLFSDKTSNDGILDVKEIRKYTEKLNNNVKEIQLVGATHNVYSSEKNVRTMAYIQTIYFIMDK